MKIFTVHCASFTSYAYSVFNFVKADQTIKINQTPYLKARDKVYIKSPNYKLRSHDVTFVVGDKTDNNDNNDKNDKNDKNIKPLIVQEVVGHQEDFNKNDVVFIFYFWYLVFIVYLVLIYCLFSKKKKNYYSSSFSGLLKSIPNSRPLL
jgi:hypothetical protein